MANVITPNNPYISNGNLNECIWRLTRTMKKAGWTTVACSNGTTKVAPATNNTDNWGNNTDPLLDTYPSTFANTGVFVPWIVMRGPSTLKIPITAAPVGNPLRGEKVTQGSAEGELLGYVFDAISSTGWMVVSPRVGTFTNSSTITCEITAATFTPVGTIVTYVREFMFSRTAASSDVINHQIFYICADVVGESAQLFSSLAATSGTTASVPPGCSASAPNQFPALGIVIRGTAGTATSGSSSPMGGATGYPAGSYHVACTNAIGAPNVSVDGSFYFAGNSASAGATVGPALSGFCYTKVDDGDPGDCDPYVVLASQSTSIATWVRTVNIGTVTQTTYALGGTCVFTSSAAPFFGYQARGCPVASRDVPSIYVGGYYYNTSAGSSMTANYPATIRTLNHPASTPPVSRENIMIWTPGTATLSPIIKHYKGRARWLSAVSVGNVLDTFDNKKFICTGSATSSIQAVMIGPWDGITTPAA